MTVGAIVFDYFGTLTPTIVEMITPRERQEMGAALGVDPDELESAWRASFVARSTGHTGDLPATLRTLAGQVGGRPSDAAVAVAVDIRVAAYRRSATPRPETVSVLTRLRERGLRLAVVSDCSAELVGMWPELPVAPLVDATVFSVVVGVRKPDPTMYRLACERLDVPPADCLYVGDGGSGELTGASAFGMRAVLLADADWAHGHRYDTDTDWRGETITALTDVPSLVGGPG